MKILFLRQSSDIRNAAMSHHYFWFLTCKRQLEREFVTILVTMSSKRKCECNLHIPYLHIMISKDPLVWSSVWHEDRQQYSSIWADFQTLILLQLFWPILSSGCSFSPKTSQCSGDMSFRAWHSQLKKQTDKNSFKWRQEDTHTLIQEFFFPISDRIPCWVRQLSWWGEGRA